MKTYLSVGLAIGLLGGTSALAQTYASGVNSGTGRHTVVTADAAIRLAPGDRVPDEYQQDRYVVRDWESNNLESPPAGYRWLGTDNGQYLLTSMSTGQIADTVDQHGRRRMEQRGDDRQSDARANAASDVRWSRGDRASDQYRRDDHSVNDWQLRNLRTPPRGYTWVRNGNAQYAMVSRSTGRIIEVVNQDRYRQDYTWSRGDQLSGGYLDARYTVRDWHSAGLPRPARGHHWVHVNGRYMLTSLRTGTIREIRNINR